MYRPPAPYRTTPRSRRPLAAALAVAAVAVALLAPGAELAAQAAPETLRAEDLAALRWRGIGPAVTSGRIVSFAVDPRDERVVYAASASGGLWKTTDAGTGWTPVFDGERSVSLGVVELDPSNPDVVWLGTGEQNSVRSSSFGDGVYRSDDGGATWRHVGLEGSRHVGRILVHPDDPDVVFVAAMGSLWGPNPERGLYRTVDGGESWERVLEGDEHTGVVEVRMDPRDPDVMLAATFQRERRQWSMLGGGPGSGLYRSEDGGDSWVEVGGGFPTGDLGRIGIDFCPSDPDVVYATAVGPTGGTFRSDDGGLTWERRNAEVQSHWYYGELVCDPGDPDRLYVPVTPLLYTTDGGRTFENLVTTNVHVDHHALWVDPDDPEHMIVGNDGGIYVSRDRGESWSWQQNVPVMQLYTVSADMQEPFYHVYGGTQDNGSWGGPVGTRFEDGVANADWLFTAGGDGFHSQADPEDPDIVYAESQYGVLQRLDRRTGERRRIQPWQPQDGDAEPYRWNWSAPLQISPHDNRVLYFAANVVFRSPDRGESWDVVSPDLTRGIPRDSLPLQGRVQPPGAIDLHASTALYGNISTLAVSSARPGLVAVGTDDGLVQVTRNDGGTWHRTAVFPGVPEMTKVAMVAWSASREGTLLAVFDGHKDNRFTPFVVRSDDHGQTWRNVTGDLPSFGPTRSVAVHPRNADLVFVGTEFGVFFTNVGGDRWVALDHGLPTVAVHDMEVHPRENDLVLGTHGRGFQVLDQITLLEELTPAVAASHSHMATPRRSFQIRDADRGRDAVGDSYWTAPNPPRGAILDWWIGDPGVGEPVRLDIMDADGGVLRTLVDTVATRGAHRAVWDLRHPPVPGAGGEPTRLEGRFVLPGAWTARLTVGARVHERAVPVRPDPALRVTDDERVRLHRTLATQARLVTAAEVADAVVETVLETGDAARAALADRPDAPAALGESLTVLEAALRPLDVTLNGPDEGGVAQQETVLPLRRLASRLYGSTESWSGPPTADQARLTGVARERLAELLARLGGVLDGELAAARSAFAEAGVPWPTDAPPELPRDLLSPGGSGAP